MSQEVGLRIRLQNDLRRQFIDVCRIQDTTAAQVLRAFMRSYVDQHGASVRQGKLFITTADRSTRQGN